MNPWIIKKILFPLHEALSRRKTFKFLDELEKVQNYTEAEVSSYQLNKLKKLLIHSYKNVPYYSDVFIKANFNPSKIKGLSDLEKLPFLSKRKIKGNIEGLKAENLKNELIRLNTGGSSGEPLIFYIDRLRQAYDKAANLRSRRWWGVDVGEREIVFWGSPIELTSQDKLKELRDVLFNTKLLSAFEMSDDVMFRYFKIIKKFKPKHIFGYPSSICLFAEFVKKNNLKINDVGIKAIFVTSEMLYDFQRKTIEDVFGCLVANGYGGRDGGFIAHQCPNGNMHITEDIIVEIVDENGNVLNDGETGEIVVTHLDAYAMPFIRYQMGDRGCVSREKCSCGMQSKILEKIEGRTTDFIVAPNGKKMHALSLIYVLRDLDGVESFKIVQERVDYLKISIVKNDKFTDEIEGLVKEKIVQRMESNVTIDVAFVSEILPEKNGKYRYVVSKVKA